MSWTNSDLARPDSLYREHFQRVEERLQVNAKTTLGRHHPVPPVTRASDDKLTHAPGQPITRPTKNATPGAASGSSRPRTIGSTPPVPLTGQATHEDGHTSLGSALPKPGSPGGERLRAIADLHAGLRVPKPGETLTVRPPTPATIDLARWHASADGGSCPTCAAFLIGIAHGDAAARRRARLQLERQERAKRSTPPPSRSWPPRI
jgi:hypothetical protein